MKKVCVFVFIFALVLSSLFAASYTVMTIERPESAGNPFFGNEKKAEAYSSEMNNGNLYNAGQKLASQVGESANAVHSSAVANAHEAQQAAEKTLKNAQAETQSALDSAKAQADDIVNNARMEAQSIVSSAQKEAQRIIDNARTEAERTMNNAQSSVQSGAEKVQNAAQNVAGTVSQTAENVQDAAKDALETAGKTSESVLNTAGETLGNAQDAASGAQESIAVGDVGFSQGGGDNFYSNPANPDVPAKKGRLKANANGKFKLGVTAGYTVHNGKYETSPTNGGDKEFELKSDFFSFAIMASYKLNIPLEIYGNVRFGFPGSIKIDGLVHDSKNHWNTDKTSTSDYTSSRSFTAFSLGAAYVFDLDDFRILAGGGFNYNVLNRTEEHKKQYASGSTITEKKKYNFSGFGLNLHLEGRYELTDYCVISLLFSPSLSFSAKYKEEYKENGKTVYDISETVSKVNLDYYVALGALFKF